MTKAMQMTVAAIHGIRDDQMPKLKQAPPVPPKPVRKKADKGKRRTAKASRRRNRK